MRYHILNHNPMLSLIFEKNGHYQNVFENRLWHVRIIPYKYNFRWFQWLNPGLPSGLFLAYTGVLRSSRLITDPNEGRGGTGTSTYLLLPWQPIAKDCQRGLAVRGSLTGGLQCRMSNLRNVYFDSHYVSYFHVDFKSLL